MSSLESRKAPPENPTENGSAETEPEPPSYVDQVWEHYRTHHPKARVLSAKARKLILQHLKAGFTVVDLRKAIDGNHKSPFHCGQNERQESHHSLALIVRDADQVQKFIDIADSPDKPVLGAKSQLTARAAENFKQTMLKGCDDGK